MLLLATCLAVAIGWYVVRLVWPLELLAATRPLRLMVAWGVGAGVVSLVFFANLVLIGEAKAGWLWACEGVLLAALVVANRRRGLPPSLSSSSTMPSPVVARAPIVWVLGALFVVALVAAVVGFVLDSLAHPHGIDDAISIWNMRARMLFDSGPSWRRAVAPELPHPDYPLLLPCLVTSTWQCHGEATTAVPAMLAAGFTFGIVGLLWASLRVLRGPAIGCLAGGVLLGCPAFLTAGATQYADLPLGFFMLCALVLLALQDHFRRPDLRFVCLAGLASGLGAWTKNEGAVCLVALPIARAIALRSRGWTAMRSELVALALGATPAIVALLVFKGSLASTNDLVGQVFAGKASDRVFDGTRYAEILDALAITTWSLGPLVVGGALVWFALHRRDRIGLPFAVMGLTLLGYLAVYLLVSPNLTWHLSTSMQRLLLQLLPSTLFGVFSGRARAG